MLLLFVFLHAEKVLLFFFIYLLLSFLCVSKDKHCGEDSDNFLLNKTSCVCWHFSPVLTPPCIVAPFLSCESSALLFPVPLPA